MPDLSSIMIKLQILPAEPVGSGTHVGSHDSPTLRTLYVSQLNEAQMLPEELAALEATLESFVQSQSRIVEPDLQQIGSAPVCFAICFIGHENHDLMLAQLLQSHLFYELGIERIAIHYWESEQRHLLFDIRSNEGSSDRQLILDYVLIDGLDFRPDERQGMFELIGQFCHHHDQIENLEFCFSSDRAVSFDIKVNDGVMPLAVAKAYTVNSLTGTLARAFNALYTQFG